MKHDLDELKPSSNGYIGLYIHKYDEDSLGATVLI